MVWLATVKIDLDGQHFFFTSTGHICNVLTSILHDICECANNRADFAQIHTSQVNGKGPCCWGCGCCWGCSFVLWCSLTGLRWFSDTQGQGLIGHTGRTRMLCSFLNCGVEKKSKQLYLLVIFVSQFLQTQIQIAFLPMMEGATNSSTSERSMSSTSRLSLSPGEESGLGASPIAIRSSSKAWPSSSGSGVPMRVKPRKGDSEPVGDGASSEGEGIGESSGSGKEALSASSFFLRCNTRLAKVW